jgi:hypothetical protein
LYSTANDLGKWILFNLKLGAGPGGHIVSEGTMNRLHRTNAPLSLLLESFPEFSETGYGLGWVTHHYRGRKVVEHGGSRKGFVTSVAFIPQEGVGAALLMNNSEGSAHSYMLLWPIIDDLLGAPQLDWMSRIESLYKMETPPTQVSCSPPPSNAQDYVGVYHHPAYGEFSIAAFGGRLALDYYRPNSTRFLGQSWLCFQGDGSIYLENVRFTPKLKLDVGTQKMTWTEDVSVEFIKVSNKPTMSNELRIFTEAGPLGPFLGPLRMSSPAKVELKPFHANFTL